MPHFVPEFGHGSKFTVFSKRHTDYASSVKGKMFLAVDNIHLKVQKNMCEIVWSVKYHNWVQSRVYDLSLGFCSLDTN